MTRTPHHSAAAWELARQMRAAGKGWYRIEARTGISYHVLRGEMEPGYREQRSQQSLTTRRKVKRDYVVRAQIHKGIPLDRIRPDEAVRVISRIPPDTRSWQARFMGDPMPGRSALDRLNEKCIRTGGASASP